MAICEGTVVIVQYQRYAKTKQQRPAIPACDQEHRPGGWGWYSLYEGYYVCSAILTPLFQVYGKFV